MLRPLKNSMTDRARNAENYKTSTSSVNMEFYIFWQIYTACWDSISCLKSGPSWSKNRSSRCVNSLQLLKNGHWKIQIAISRPDLQVTKLTPTLSNKLRHTKWPSGIYARIALKAGISGCEHVLVVECIWFRLTSLMNLILVQLYNDPR